MPPLYRIQPKIQLEVSFACSSIMKLAYLKPFHQDILMLNISVKYNDHKSDDYALRISPVHSRHWCDALYDQP
jgi:hypothetical protein